MDLKKRVFIGVVGDTIYTFSGAEVPYDHISSEICRDKVFTIRAEDEFLNPNGMAIQRPM
jgi:hypothetical protein